MIEMILSVAILGVMTLLIISANSNFLTRINLDTKSDELVGMLRLSQTHAISGNGDSNWGVHILQNLSGGTNSFILFKGATYVSRDASFDVVTSLPTGYYFSTISLSGSATDVIFQKGSGQTLQDGFIEITDPNASVKRVTVSPRGVANKI